MTASYTLSQIFSDTVARIGGQQLVKEVAESDPAFAVATHVLAVGKVALPMLWGMPHLLAKPHRKTHRKTRRVPRRILVITPSGAATDVAVDLTSVGLLADDVSVIPADHPRPTANSVAAAQAADAFVRSIGSDPSSSMGVDTHVRLLVLLSGGASSLLCAPAAGLGWEEKSEAVDAVARAGATIRELNAVRKHLSAIKGGRLALACRAPISVRALSDVIGDDPATIGSGPFSPDPTTFADAVEIVSRLGAVLPAAARTLLEQGVRGDITETPKPGTDALDHVDYRVLAGPARVVAEARAAVARAGADALELDGGHDPEETVEARAAAVGARVADAVARASSNGARASAAGARPRIFVGGGEPRVVLPPTRGTERGGRATHLALLVARGLAQLPEAWRARVAFLAAGTDDRDGNTDVSGAIVDGTTWSRALALGLDPAAALRAFDSLPLLAATGDTVRGPGTSNLLDLHLLLIGA